MQNGLDAILNREIGQDGIREFGAGPTGKKEGGRMGQLGRGMVFSRDPSVKRCKITTFLLNVYHII